MKRVFRMAERAAETDATVLLEGESGTGKSRIARMIHRWSDRKDRPFVSVNCAALPEQLLESELFGYEKGAFTGAHTKRRGKFEAARNGTIFLDEIGEISLPLQAKLLQVVQEKSFMPLGSNRMVHVNVRIIAATNRDLKTMVEEGLVPGGPVLPAEYHRYLHPAPAGAEGRHPPSYPGAFWKSSGPNTTNPFTLSPRAVSTGW